MMIATTKGEILRENEVMIADCEAFCRSIHDALETITTPAVRKEMKLIWRKTKRKIADLIADTRRIKSL